MKNYQVSICIPAYNEPEFLESALLSCLTQSFTNFEIVICDDSPDEFIESIARKYVDSDDRIRYFRNNIPLGAAGNSNRTVEYATGEWIKFLYQDDTFVDNESLQHLVDQTPCCDFIVSPSIWKKSGSTGVHRLNRDQLGLFSHDPIAALLRFGNIIGAPSATMLKKSFFIPFDERMTWMFDLAMYLEVAINRPNFKILLEPAIVINLHSRQLTKKVSGSDVLELTESLMLFNRIGPKCDCSSEAYSFVLRKMIIHGSRLSHLQYVSILNEACFKRFWSTPLWITGSCAHTLVKILDFIFDSIRLH